MRPPVPLPASTRWAARPLAISSANGLRAVQKAYDLILRGADTLDAAIEGVKIQELDPNDHTVGYGGLPNAPGVGRLAPPLLHGPTRAAAAAGGLAGVQ